MIKTSHVTGFSWEMVPFFTDFGGFLSFRAVYNDVPFLGHASERLQVLKVQDMTKLAAIL